MFLLLYKFSFVRIKLTDKMIDHMDIESTCIHKDSEEAQLQLQMDSNATGNLKKIKILWYDIKRIYV